MNWADFHFLRPLWLLASIPALGLLFGLVRGQRQNGHWSSVCDAALLPFILERAESKQRRWPLVLGSFACLLSILALAGPSWQRLPSPAFRNASALVIALDLSVSMDAADLKPSRLVRARYKIDDILKQRKDGQTALIVYAGDAFTVTPLTNDNETIENQLSALNTGIMPSQGNNTVLALHKAQELLQQAGLQKGQILLVTDAVDIGRTLPAIDKLGDYRVSILAVGTPEGAPIKAAQGGVVKNAKGDIIVPKLNMPELARLAKAGQGILVRLADDNSDIDDLAHFFEQSVQQGIENNHLLLEQWADQGPWLVLLVLPLAALFFRKGLLSIALIIVCLPMPNQSYATEWRDLWLSKDQQAQRAFRKQDYKAAAEQFNNPEWRAAANYKAGNYQQALDDLKNIRNADSFYNQGNALAQSGQLAEAVKAYEQALKLKPDDADAKYNKELVERELQKQKQEQQNQQQGQQEQQQDKSEQNNQDKKQVSEQNSQQNQSGQSGNNSPENSSGQQKAEPENHEKQQDNPAQTESNQQDGQEQQKSAERETQEAPDESTKTQTPAPAAETQTQTESEQANEQWLKRIPDDPAGLLRRKFKYQYSQRRQQAPDNAEAW